jgi:hypothetical protein
MWILPSTRSRDVHALVLEDFEMLALFFVFCAVVFAEPNFKYDLDSVAPAGTPPFIFITIALKTLGDKEKALELLKVGTGGPYTYSQAGHRFFGTGFDGSHIDTSAACSGNSGPCRNNPQCQCRVSGTYLFVVGTSHLSVFI